MRLEPNFPAGAAEEIPLVIDMQMCQQDDVESRNAGGASAREQKLRIFKSMVITRNETRS